MFDTRLLNCILDVLFHSILCCAVCRMEEQPSTMCRLGEKLTQCPFCWEPSTLIWMLRTRQAPGAVGCSGREDALKSGLLLQVSLVDLGLLTHPNHVAL